MPINDDKTNISIYVDNEVHDEIQQIAEKEKRTISKQMQKIYQDWKEEHELDLK